MRIVDLQEGTFYADLVFDRDIKVSARPSDSVAIALRAGVPIFVEEAVLAEAGLLIPDENDDEARHGSRGRGGEVQGISRQRVAGRLQGDLIDYVTDASHLCARIRHADEVSPNP